VTPQIPRRAVIQGAIVALFSGFTAGRALGASSVSVSLFGKPLAHSAVLAVRANQAARVYLEYGTSRGGLNFKTPIVPIAKNVTKNVQVTGLSAHSTIYYRVRFALGTAKTFSSSPISSFDTAPVAADVPLLANVFAVQADPHMDENSTEEVYLKTLAQIVAASPAFLMDLGDIFMVDKLVNKSEANIRARFELMKGYYGNLKNIPLKITLGNHDGELGYSNFNTKSYRKEYFPEQSGDLAYYSFLGPDSLHISLDPFTYTTKNPTSNGWEWTLGKAQYDWLKATLAASREKHKFIYIHHLLVGNAQSRGGVEIAKFNEWGGLNIDGTPGFEANRPGWGKPIHQMLIEYNVGFVFKGHDHLYVKQELDGIIYQTVPQPSHAGDKVNSAGEYGYVSGKIVGGSGFMKVTTLASEARVEFVKYDGTIADSYVRTVSA